MCARALPPEVDGLSQSTIVGSPRRATPAQSVREALVVDTAEQDEIDLARFQSALAALDDDALRDGLANMNEKALQEMAGHLNLPRATIHLGEALVPLVRRKLRTAHVEHQLTVAFAMTDDINGDTVDALGDHAEDPSRDELLEVLPAVLEEHSPQLVTLMMAAYSVSDAPCRAVMRDLLETDDRFAIPEAIADVDDADATPTFGALPPSARGDDDPELEAKREQRRETKAARKAESAKQKQARAAGETKRREAQHQAKKRRSTR